MTEYRFCREIDGTQEWVTTTIERWCWVATYTDGSRLCQFDPETYLFHRFNEIQQDKLASFSMVSSEGKRPFILHWKPGRKLIHYYYNYKLDIGLPTYREYRLYCFGYEETAKGHKVIIVIMPDDGVIITDNPDSIRVT